MASPVRDDDVLEEGLERLQGFGPEYGPSRFSNHGPMAADALVHLGRGEAVAGWVDSYRRRLDAPRPAVAPVDPKAWQEALGDGRRATDWTVLFTRQLDGASWPDVLVTWLPRFLPGLSAAAGHGLIRTAHAVRALEAADTPLRRAELAAALGYWASRVRPLPGRPALSGAANARDALAALPRPDGPPRAFSIDAALRGLDGDDAFTAALDGLAAPPTVDDGLSDLTEAMAGQFLADAGGAPIAYLHGVTAPAAARLLLPHLPADLHLAVFAAAWQTCAALVATYGWGRPPVVPGPPDGRTDWSALADRAVATGDEHAIKLTEACRREHRLVPSPLYAAAAAAVCDQMGGRR